jgi:hypothetical protein
MASRFINGARYAIATAVAAPVAISAVTNANPPVASASATPNNDSVVIITSGWPELNETIVKTSGEVDGVSFQLAGYDATDTDRFPVGEGIGTYAIASSFVTLNQVRDVNTDGGDQQYFEYQYVEDAGGRQRRVPTFKNAMGMNIVMDYDPDLPWYDALVEADRAKEPVVLRETLPNGDQLYYYGYLGFNKVPTHGINENMTVTATFSLQSDPVRYPA